MLPFFIPLICYLSEMLKPEREINSLLNSIIDMCKLA